MKSANINLILIIFLIFLHLVGCTKFVQVDPPVTQLVTSSVFSNSSTATAAITNIYTQIQSNSLPYYLPLYTGLSGDELINYSGPSLDGYYMNSLTVNNQSIFTLWSEMYNWIYQANAIISNLKDSTVIYGQTRNQLVGEAKFIRGFLNFYLINLWGDAPLILTTGYSQNATASKVALATVYEQIVADLKDAQNLLNSNFVDVSDTTSTSERVRPTKWAAMALLARVYLYTGDFPDAVTLSTAVINNTVLFSLDSLNAVFLANSTEAIWQIDIPQPNSFITPEGAYFNLANHFNLTGATTNCSSISNELLNAFETGDNRRLNWIDSLVTDTAVFYFPFKYKLDGSDPTNLTEYSMVLRLAEQYLIRAEAEANGAGGGLIAAISDLNIIRNRAGLQNTTSSTQSDVLTAIFHERQVELFTEWGHRWLDLKRSGNANAIMGGSTGVCATKGGSWSPDWLLYPIPLQELKSDPNLRQNKGY